MRKSLPTSEEKTGCTLKVMVTNHPGDDGEQSIGLNLTRRRLPKDQSIRASLYPLHRRPRGKRTKSGGLFRALDREML
jgi:hypothetical protein